MLPVSALLAVVVKEGVGDGVSWGWEYGVKMGFNMHSEDIVRRAI